MNDVRMIGDFVRLNKRIKTCKTGSRVAFHAPESVDSAREEGHGGRDSCSRLHGLGIPILERSEVLGAAIERTMAPIYRSMRNNGEGDCPLLCSFAIRPLIHRQPIDQWDSAPSHEGEQRSDCRTVMMR